MARDLGMPVRQLLRSMTAMELTEWEAFYLIEQEERWATTTRPGQGKKGKAEPRDQATMEKDLKAALKGLGERAEKHGR